jgi:hypothetical protein
MTLYLSPFVELSKGLDDEDLVRQAQLCAVLTLTKSMNVDEGGSFPLSCLTMTAGAVLLVDRCLEPR